MIGRPSPSASAREAKLCRSPASGGATRLGHDSIMALAPLARGWVAVRGIAVCAPHSYRSGGNGTSIARINGRSGVSFTSMRLPQQASSHKPRA